MARQHPFSLGAFHCIALEDNQQQVDIRSELGQVPQEELLAAMQAHGYSDFNTTIGFNILYVKTESHQILIDCGTGINNLLESMALAKLDPAEIDYLVITHSDFDHIGGIDHFPNATIVFPRKAYELWTTVATRDVMIEKFQEVFLKFLDPEFVARGVEYRQHYGAEKLPSLRDRMLLVDPEEEFLSGFKMVFTPGHRPDHYAVEIQSEENYLIHIADGYRHIIQVDHPEWYSRFDSFPDQMKESLILINNRIADKNALIFGSHFTFPGLAHLKNNQLFFYNLTPPE